MSLWSQIKQRRITQVVLAYLAGGWMVLVVISELVDREILPLVVYEVGLTIYLVGILGALVVGWYHGELGEQKAPLREIVLLGVVGVMALAASSIVVRGYLEEQRLALPGGLNAAYAPTRVAVLYFDDLSDDAEYGHVADGLTEGLIAELERVRDLDVVSRNGVAPYRSESLAPDSIGRALLAGTVIDGSLELAGPRLHVGIRLIDAESGVDIERASFTLPSDELLTAQDSLVASAATLLRRRLGEDLQMRERRSATGSVEAWTHLQRAERLRKDAESTLPHDQARGLELLTRADSLLRTAESLDPAWNEPTVLRATTAMRRAAWTDGTEEAVETIGGGLRLADDVIQRDPRDATAWEARGLLRWLHWLLDVSPTPADHDALLDRAQADLEQAEQLDVTRAALGTSILARIYLYERDELTRGALTARRALDADPYLANAATIYDGLWWAQYDLGQFSEADRTCREARGRFPDDVRFAECAIWMMMAPSATDPDPAVAWSLLHRADSLTPPDERPFDHSQRQIMVAGVLARAELGDSARSVLLHARVGPEVDPGQELPGWEAIVRTILGDHDEAVGLLTRYVSAHPDHQFQVEGQLHWWWRPLRDHPGFDVVVARDR